MITSTDTGEIADLFVIGGGVNGCGIARDAAGRGLSATLAEMGDLASATSSASTKLFHGGLRYLEYFEFRLVSEALHEREVLLRAMPHIARPMRFVLPVAPGMRFEGTTPASRLLGAFMPWTRGRRPAWVIRAGLALYDRMGGRTSLPPTRRIDLARDPAGAPLQPRFHTAFEYSDGWVDDARLVVLNARDAAARGARIRTRTRVTSARRDGGLWIVETEGADGPARHRARALVNAGGPWVAEILHDRLHRPARESIRLVRGSHIVVGRLFDHDRAYFFQGEDGRIIFAIPYERDFTLIGTTDQDHRGDPSTAVCTPEEQEYLCAFASRYFARPVTRDMIVRTYSGVRPLHDDGSGSATAATRDYRLDLDTDAGGAPLLNVFGGKITTYRRLSEQALDRLAPQFPGLGPAWTAGTPLPGGDFAAGDFGALVAGLRAAHPFLDGAWADRLVRAYGTEAGAIFAAGGPGRDFGATLSEAEVAWLRDREWARTAEDILWRRSKLGLRMTPAQVATLEDWLAGSRPDDTHPAGTRIAGG